MRSKRIFPVVVVVLAVLFSTALLSFVWQGCGSKTQGPGEVVVEFWKAARDGQYQTAYDLLNSSDKESVAFSDFEQLLTQQPIPSDFHLTVTDEKIEGDTATVTTEIQYSGQTGSAPFTVYKEDGQWKVSVFGTSTSTSGDTEAEACKANQQTINNAVLAYGAANNGDYTAIKGLPVDSSALVPNFVEEGLSCPTTGQPYVLNSADQPTTACPTNEPGHEL